MCLLAVVEEARLADEAKFDEALLGNQDGFGFIGIRSGKLEYERTGGRNWVRDYPGTFLQKLKEWKESASGPLVVHLRQRTHGTNDSSMAHPFPFDSGGVKGYFAHNGVFQDTLIRSLAEALKVEEGQVETLSDSARVVKIMESAQVDAETMDWALAALCHASPFNRIVFWEEGKENPAIYNDKAGFVDENTRTWYSNDWYFLAKAPNKFSASYSASPACSC